ncbi:hypothetical protein [Pseudomonas fildesensis]|uniref:hypothetical protein n=1 Tax=Pseudomonas fildesensis TaxID=1674920 RepID=UPI001568BFB6|nr:hypothetical protein [Pseudomonas fildesensis]
MALLGLDATGSTLQRSQQIKAFERRYLAANPWLNPAPLTLNVYCLKDLSLA